jgi:hypothetical protein
METKFAVLILVLAFLLGLCAIVVKASSGEIDKTAVVDWVIDGDTFRTTTPPIMRM